MTTEERIAYALENIANSLNTLAQDAKANKELKETVLQNMNRLEEEITGLKLDPFGLSTKEKE